METQTLGWALNEFGAANLGDRRRSKRLVMIGAAVASQIGMAISTACGSAGALGASRLFRRKETTLEATLTPHIKQTNKRCRGNGRILAVQDTTTLDYTSHKSKRGLGPMATCQKSRGLLMHSVVAVRDKTPLGLLGVQIWARDEAARGSRHERHERPVCEKESNKWLVGLEQAQANTSKNRSLLVVGDRESDVYALFVAPRRRNVDLLVRVAHNRALAVCCGEKRYIQDALNSAEVVGEHEVEVPRQGKRAARKAKLEVRVARVSLKAPGHGVDKHPKEQVEVSLVWAFERAPEQEEPLEWVLLCTEVVDGLSSAVEMIGAYSTRWMIEEFHHVLKSGCKVERIQFDTVDSMLPAIGVLAVVAWRVLYLAKLARSSPEIDASEVADKDEVEVLNQWLAYEGKKYRIRTARDFTIAVATLGGFLARKSDGMPGTKNVWQGLRDLTFLIMGYKVAARSTM